MCFPFCHNDELLKTIELPSSYEQMKQSGPKSVEVETMRIMPAWQFSKTVISIVRCQKCGRIKHITSVGPTLRGYG